MPERDKFAILWKPRRVWAVAAIHGEVERLRILHGELARRFAAGDRLIYLGNYLGIGDTSATVDEVLDFRRWLIAQPFMFATDVAHLRGAQEEMWQKLLQLQFAPNPREVLEWMLGQGVGATLRAYGGDERHALAVSRNGALAIARWSTGLRAAMRSCPGHTRLISSLKRAAVTSDGRLLFVHAGIDPSRPLSAQSDSFWWNRGGFSQLSSPYAGFARVVRGFDRRHAGVTESAYTTSIDAGCGFGGPLVAACFDLSGGIVERIEA